MMQSKAPVYRKSKDMKEGKEEVIEIERKFKIIEITDCSLVLENLLTRACQEMYGAENRRESRGAQAHEGYLYCNDVEWMKRTETWVSGTEIAYREVKLEYRPGCDQLMDDEMHHVPPAKRVY